MLEQQKKNIKNLIEYTNDQVELQLCEAAATIRKAAVKPFCDEHGLIFKQGMGAFIFMFKDEAKKHIKLCCSSTAFGGTSTISDKDAELLGEGFIEELEEVSDTIYEDLGGRPNFQYMEDYPNGD